MLHAKVIPGSLNTSPFVDAQLANVHGNTTTCISCPRDTILGYRPTHEPHVYVFVKGVTALGGSYKHASSSERPTPDSDIHIMYSASYARAACCVLPLHVAAGCEHGKQDG